MSAPTDVQQALADLKRARAWALKHFNVGAEHSGLFDAPTFEIDFEADRMTAYPRSYGKRIVLGVSYRLKWVGGQVGWEGYGVLSGEPFTWLRVTKD